MTPEMIRLARENAEKSGLKNVEFRLGEIENLPVEDGAVDAVISNCVINLSTDKERVFREIYRVLKPGGRMMVSDIVLDGELPERIKESVAAYTGCIGGALKRADYLAAMAKAGFTAGGDRGRDPRPGRPLGRLPRGGENAVARGDQVGAERHRQHQGRGEEIVLPGMPDAPESESLK